MHRTTALMAGTAALLIAKGELLRLGASAQVLGVVADGIAALEAERKGWNIDREMEARELEEAYVRDRA